MAQRTIIIRTTPDGPIQKEGIIDAAILPGMCVEYADGTRIQVMSATLDPMLRVVVDEFDVAVDGTYKSGDLVPFVTPQRGDELYMYATAPALSTLAATNKLVSDGAGFLIYCAAPIAGEAVAEVLVGQVIAANTIELVKVEVL